MSDAFLAIDVGNSRIKFGLFGPAAPGELPACHAATAIPVREPVPAMVIGRWLADRDRPAAALLSGTNPAVVASIRDDWDQAWGELHLLGQPPSALLANRTDVPVRVGPDRLFDAVAANRLRPPGVPAIVVDSGTATTVNAVGGDGAFLGGAILPGFELVASALHERTALLPRIDVADLAPPPPALGRSTEPALRSGLYWGLVGGVKELISRLSETLAGPADAPPFVLLTGGAAPLLAPHLPAARHEPHLTLQGMVLIADFGFRISD